MDSSSILMLLVGVAVGTYFHNEVSGAVPLLKNKGSSGSSEGV